MWQWILNTTGGDQQEANHNQDNREVRFGLLVRIFLDCNMKEY